MALIEYKAEAKYKVFNKDEIFDFSDTYYIKDYYDEEDVANYIIGDMLLVCGGGYNTKNIEKATVRINGKYVYRVGM